MATELERTCPACEDEQTFWRTASTTLHLGEKSKWICADCDFRFVKIDGIQSA